ncbi:MAG: hypothetical protein ABI980_09900 [Nitrospirota bacterium]
MTVFTHHGRPHKGDSRATKKPQGEKNRMLLQTSHAVAREKLESPSNLSRNSTSIESDVPTDNVKGIQANSATYAK